MQWIPTAFRFLLNRSTALRKSIMRLAFAFALLSAWLSPCSFVRADESVEIPDVFQYQLRVDDLTPEQFDSLAFLAAGASSTGNITNDVAAILDVLNSVLQGSAIKTVPMTGGSSGHTLAYEVGRGLFNSYNPGTIPTAANSYVYQLQRAMYGQNGVPTATSAVVPTLGRIEQLISSQSGSSDLSIVTNIYNVLNPTLSRIEHLLSTQNVSGASSDLTVVSNLYTMLTDWDSPVQYGIYDLLETLHYFPNGSGGGNGVSIGDMMFPRYYVDYDFLTEWNRDTIVDTPGKALELLLASPYLIPDGPGDWVNFFAKFWAMEKNFTLGSNQGGLLDSQNHSVRTTITDAEQGFYTPFATLIYDYGATPVVNALSTLVDEYWQNGQVDVLTSNTADVVTYLGNILGDTTLVNATLGDFSQVVTNQLEALEELGRMLGYTDSQRSVREDFTTQYNELHFVAQELGVENPNPTNNIFAFLKRIVGDGSVESAIAATSSVFKAQEAVAAANASNEVSTASNLVATTAEEEPDWENDRYTGDNPVSSGDRILDLPARNWAVMHPDLPQSQRPVITLFRGNFPIYGGANVRSGSSVPLDISYALTDNDANISNAMTSMHAIMEFVWDWVFIILSVAMLFKFYKALTDGIEKQGLVGPSGGS